MAALLPALGGANELLLALPPPSSLPPPTAASSRSERERWIRAKYEERRFVERREGDAPSGSELCAAAAADAPLALLRLLLAAGDVDAPGGGCTPLHAAAAAGAPLCCELLLLSGASLESRGEQGRTALHHAAAAGARECVSLLLRRGADASAADEAGATPLALARAGGEAAADRARFGGVESELQRVEACDAGGSSDGGPPSRPVSRRPSQASDVEEGGGADEPDGSPVPAPAGRAGGGGSGKPTPKAAKRFDKLLRPKVLRPRALSSFAVAGTASNPTSPRAGAPPPLAALTSGEPSLAPADDPPPQPLFGQHASPVRPDNLRRHRHRRSQSAGPISFAPGTAAPLASTALETHPAGVPPATARSSSSDAVSIASL